MYPGQCDGFGDRSTFGYTKNLEGKFMVFLEPQVALPRKTDPFIQLLPG